MIPALLKALALVVATSLLAGCTTAPLPAYGLASDGDCVSRTVSVYDRDLGQDVPVTQRFCGGRTFIAH